MLKSVRRLNMLSVREDIVESLLVNIQDELKAEAGEFVLAMAPLTKGQLTICSRIYTTPAEAIILHSFMSQSVITRGNLGMAEN
jgi:hypothetical protein